MEGAEGTGEGMAKVHYGLVQKHPHETQCCIE